MRKINPNVSLPYWDYTIDYKLTEPADSVVWTHCFFGQNDDESQIIKDGPFKDFYGAHGAYLSRAPGSSCRDRLINDKDVETVKNNCHYKVVLFFSVCFKCFRFSSSETVCIWSCICLCRLHDWSELEWSKAFPAENAFTFTAVHPMLAG